MSFKDVIESARPSSYDEPSVDCSWGEFSKVIRSRRSVRIFDSTPVPSDVVQNAIDAGLIAPNSSNLQQAEFYWVRSQEKKSQLVEACLSQPAAKTAQELIVIVARLDTWQRNAKAVLQQLKTNGAPKAAVTYYEKIVPLAYRLGPCGLFGLVKRIVFNVQGLKEPTPREPKSLADMRVWAHKSAALAAENFMLAIRAQGFDTCPMEGFDSARVRALLGLRCRAEINMVIAIGRRGKGGIYGPQTRLPRENFVFEV